uniref:HAT C-terminal dimerisation domain-containing protein n=1 Tax=Anopheles christyi TaxID=43041 RepID=A0A182KF77_9DIPT
MSHQDLITPITSYSQIHNNQKENDQYRDHLFGDFVSRINVGEEASDSKTKAKLELDEYLAAGYVELDPLVWWKQNQTSDFRALRMSILESWTNL